MHVIILSGLVSLYT